MNHNNQQPGSADLPPLPRHEYCLNSQPVLEGYTAHQMRQYARDAIAASRRAVGGEVIATDEDWCIKHTNANGKVGWVHEKNQPPALFSKETASVMCVTPEYTAHKVRVTYAVIDALASLPDGAMPEQIPTGIYFSAEHDNFYSVAHTGMGDAFYRRWQERASEFPKTHEAARAAQPAEGSAQVATDEQQDQSVDLNSALRAEPAGQQDANLAAALLVKELSSISMSLAADLVSGSEYTFQGCDYLDRNWVVDRVMDWRAAWDKTGPARAELSARCRVEGGVTCDKSGSAIAAEGATPAGDVREPWIPYLSDRADGCAGHYAIARWNPDGYREVWNLRSHQWAAFSDDVLTLDQAHHLLRKLVIPTARIDGDKQGEQGDA